MWCLAAILASGCAATGPATDACALFSPVYTSREDVLTRETAAQILINNEAGAAICGWRRAAQRP